MSDHSSSGSLDDVRQDADVRRQAGVCVKYTRAAFSPRYIWRIDGFFDVCAIKVDLSAFWQVVEAARESKRIKQNWASGAVVARSKHELFNTVVQREESSRDSTEIHD